MAITPLRVATIDRTSEPGEVTTLRYPALMWLLSKFNLIYKILKAAKQYDLQAKGPKPIKWGKGAVEEEV